MDRELLIEIGLEELPVVARAGVGLDNVDITAATNLPEKILKEDALWSTPIPGHSNGTPDPEAASLRKCRSSPRARPASAP